METIASAKRGIAMIIGRDGAYMPQIWVEDAAAAIVKALTAPVAGIYDIVDDDPLTRRELVQLLAQAVGERWLLRPPMWLARLIAGPDQLFAARSQRVTNQHFREATGWTPVVPSAREGWTRIRRES